MVVPVRVVQPKGYGAPGPESKALQGRARVALVVGVLLTTAAGRAAHFTPPPKSTEPEACPLTRAPVLACGCDKGMRKGPGESGAGPGSIRARPQVSFAPFSAGSAATTTDWPARRPTLLPCTFTSIAEMNRGGQDAQGKARASVPWSLQGVGGWAPSAGKRGRQSLVLGGRKKGTVANRARSKAAYARGARLKRLDDVGGLPTDELPLPTQPTDPAPVDRQRTPKVRESPPTARPGHGVVRRDRDTVRGDSATPVLNRQERYASLQDRNALGTIGTTARSEFRRARVAIVIHMHTPFFLPD